MNQRGISRRLVDFTRRHGRIEGDKHILDRKTSRRLIDELEEEFRLTKQVLDKGGDTVVEGGRHGHHCLQRLRTRAPTKRRSPHV